MARLPNEQNEPHDGLYVGYLPTPLAISRFLRVLVPAILATLIVAGAVVAIGQRDPGGAVWSTGELLTIEGRLVANPYPRIVTQDDSVLLVEEGKFGARDRASVFDGRAVRATGYPLTRDGRTVLELAAAADAIVEVGVADDAGIDRRETADVAVVLSGEIVDSKCYSGAMKPGDGKAHKACAILCIRGGIPPVLVTFQNDASHTLLLTAEDGGPIGDWILNFVGEPVEVRGRRIQLNGDEAIAVEAGNIRLR